MSRPHTMSDRATGDETLAVPHTEKGKGRLL